MRKRRRHPLAFLTAIGLGLFVPFGWLIAHLPAGAGLWAGRRFGDLLWMALPRRRAMALGNLARAFGDEYPGGARRRLGRESFEHLGMNLVEDCLFFFRSPAALLSRVDLADVHRVDEAAEQGKGILVLTAHFGNWELLAAAHVLHGVPLSVVVRPLDDPALDRVVERFRQRSGVELISKRRALRDIIDALRRGRMVGILLDQNASRAEGVFAPFFGHPASTSKALAVISLRTGAPVVPIFIRRTPDGRHRVEVQKMLTPPPDGDVTRYTGMFNAAIEDAIRRAPEQWFWMHDRWKTRPRAESV